MCLTQAMPARFEEIKYIVSMIDDERDGMSGEEVDPHPTAFNNYIYTNDHQSSAHQNLENG